MQKYGRFIQELNVTGSSPLQSLLVTADPQEQHQKDRNQAVVLLPNLRTLDISTCCTLREVDAWLLHCPRLKSLILCNVRSLPSFDIKAGDRVAQLLKHCPRLTRLGIDNTGFHDSLQGADLAEIISCWPPLLTDFRIMDDGLPHRWFPALSGFLERLTVLDLYECKMAEDWMLKRIVCSSPLLVQLGWHSFDVNGLFIEEDAGAAAAVSVTPIATSVLSAAEEKDAGMGPWACIGLRKLKLFTISWSDSPFCNKAAMEHLALLKDLRRLTVDVMTGDIDSADGPWPDETRAYSVEDLLRVPEVRWMRETWPLLEYFELQRWSWI